jgi:predicted nucleic acid-binding protein
MLVLDASTLILIARIELLGPFVAGANLKITIPKEVERECCGAKKTIDAHLIQNSINGSRIAVLAVSDRKLVAKLRRDFGLGLGEAEAIALALAEEAKLVGIDDKNGINACKLLGIPFTTAIGILIRSVEKRLIDQAGALSKLEGLARFGRYRVSIIEDARRRLEAQG